LLLFNFIVVGRIKWIYVRVTGQTMWTKR